MMTAQLKDFLKRINVIKYFKMESKGNNLGPL